MAAHGTHIALATLALVLTAEGTAGHVLAMFVTNFYRLCRYVKVLLPFLCICLLIPTTANARCDHPDDYDSAGRRCGGRAASVREGGRLGGDGYYKDSYGRKRKYGRGNDEYDR